MADQVLDPSAIRTHEFHAFAYRCGGFRLTARGEVIEFRATRDGYALDRANVSRLVQVMARGAVMKLIVGPPPPEPESGPESGPEFDVEPESGFAGQDGPRI